jgi:hypothetical protein
MLLNATLIFIVLLLLVVWVRGLGERLANGSKAVDAIRPPVTSQTLSYFYRSTRPELPDQMAPK